LEAKLISIESLTYPFRFQKENLMNFILGFAHYLGVTTFSWSPAEMPGALPGRDQAVWHG